MPRTKQPQGQAQDRSRLFLAAIGVAALALLIILTVTTRMIRSSESHTPPASVVTNDPTKPTVPNTTIVMRDEVVGRLHQIFRIRDRAIQTRDARVLKEIYTVDCPCLKGDEALIKRLKNEKLVWKGVKVSLFIERTEQVNDRLWIVNALVKTSSFEINENPAQRFEVSLRVKSIRVSPCQDQ